MSERLEALAREKQVLLMRSALCRLRLRRDVHAVRGSLPWKHPFVSRFLFAARLVRTTLGYVRAFTRPSVCGIEQTPRERARSLARSPRSIK